MTGNDLLGTTNLPFGHEMQRDAAYRARAYHALKPYPYFGFRDWKVEDRGPHPRCRPLVRAIVRKGARWLWGRPCQVKVAEGGSPLADLWSAERMQSRLKAAAEQGGQDGGYVLKWSWARGDQWPKVRVLNAIDNVRMYWDPDDPEQLLMARSQWPSYDARTGRVVWHREDWTEDWCVVYRPVEQAQITGSTLPILNPYNAVAHIDQYGGWQVETQERNAAGVIPFAYVRNDEGIGAWGTGDLWQLWESIDQLNFTHALEHADNQLAVRPFTYYIDLQPETSDRPAPIAPDDGEAMVTRPDAKSQGRIEQVQRDSAVREPLSQFAKALEREIYEAAGASYVDSAEITNKGNLTRAVMRLLYANQIETTEEKRRAQGASGVCRFLEDMALGMSRLRAPGWSETQGVEIAWPDYFDLVAEDINLEIATLNAAVENHFMPHERAVLRVANMYDCEDPEAWLSEVAEQKAQAIAQAQGAADPNNGEAEHEEPEAGATRDTDNRA